MAVIVQIEDFTGRYQVAKDALSKKNLQYYIDELENCLLYDLLGAELGTLFIADLDVNGVPQTQRFIDIYNSFAIDDDKYCDTIRISKGIKEYLIACIYFDYARNSNTYNSQLGNKSSSTENSEYAGNLIHDLSQRYNKGIATAKEIQWYCECYKPEDYPEFNGGELDYTSWY